MRLQVVVTRIIQHSGDGAITTAARELELRLRLVPELHEIDGDLQVRLVVVRVDYPGLTTEGVDALQRAVLLLEPWRRHDEDHVRRHRLRRISDLTGLARDFLIQHLGPESRPLPGGGDRAGSEDGRLVRQADILRTWRRVLQEAF